MPKTKARPKSKPSAYWTPERLEQIPKVYRDCLLVFNQIIESRDSVLRIDRITISQIHTYVAHRHGYDIEQVIELVNNLVRAGLIEGPDKLGFFAPTPAGEVLIRALADYVRSGAKYVPPFPNFAE